MKQRMEGRGATTARLRRLMMLGLLSAAVSPLMAATAMAAQDGIFSTLAHALAQADVPPAQAAGEAELKALTEQVLQSLGAASGAGAKEPSGKSPRQPAAGAAPAGDYQALMNALTTLMEKATRQGKSSEDIYALIQEALANQDDETLDALISRAGGKVELQKLLRALVQKAALKAAADDPYTRMLQAEGEATQVREATANAGIAGQSSTAEGGERTIVVQPGDTLGIIAMKHYGSVQRWRDIFRANRDRLTDPDLVPAGIRLRLP